MLGTGGRWFIKCCEEFWSDPNGPLKMSSFLRPPEEGVGLFAVRLLIFAKVLLKDGKIPNEGHKLFAFPSQNTMLHGGKESRLFQP